MYALTNKLKIKKLKIKTILSKIIDYFCVLQVKYKQ